MKKLHPYKNVEDTISELDNGGRFYDLFAKAADGVISGAELGKVAGIFNDKQKAILFFELSISKFDQSQKYFIISKLDNDLQNTYQKYKPQYLKPSEADQEGIISCNAIITGIPKLVESKSEFKGIVMVPVVAAKVITFIMIPLMDKYDVYELRDEKFAEIFFIAHSKDVQKLPHKKIEVAGVIKELKLKDEEVDPKKFLEVVYYSDAD